VKKKKRKDPHAVALGRKGGKVSAGKNLRVWMAKMTPKERSEMGRKAVRARWKRAKRKGKGKRVAK
jgi:hypothetical protein